MSASVSAVYHHNEFDSTAAAYGIGIRIKNWVREYVVYHAFGVVGPIVPWFAEVVVVVMLWWAAQKYKIPSQEKKYQNKETNDLICTGRHASALSSDISVVNS